VAATFTTTNVGSNEGRGGQKLSFALAVTTEQFQQPYSGLSKQMPRITRELFPAVLGQLADSGVIEITVTEEEVSLRMLYAPQLGVYRVERKRTLH
jgi:hypothetical protein